MLVPFRDRDQDRRLTRDFKLPPTTRTMRSAGRPEEATRTMQLGWYGSALLSVLSILLGVFLLRSSSDLHHSLGLDGFAGPGVTRDGEAFGGAEGNGAGSCRMTWMNPSYVRIPSVQSQFSLKYSLFLYRELGWDLEQEPSRSPVLFIPGNAGSFRQVRSLASVAATTYFLSPQSPRLDYQRRGHPGLDFFTLDLNDEFSAFHGRTLLQQAEYANDAVRAILSLYRHSRKHTHSHLPTPASVLVVGHSMGGVLGRKMVTMPNYLNHSINTIISLSSPHSIPPITFEGGMEKIYQSIHAQPTLQDILLVSIAGGSSDSTVSSDSSSLLSLAPPTSSLTLFTTGIPKVWTPIDHRAILWCNQLAIVTAKTLLQITDPRLPAQVGPVRERLDILTSHLIHGRPITTTSPADSNGNLHKFHQLDSLPTDTRAYQIHAPLQSLRLTQTHLAARNNPSLQTHIIPLPENSPPGLEFTLLSTLAVNHRLNVLACKGGTFETHLLQHCSSISARQSQLLPQSRFNFTPTAAPGPDDQAKPPLVATSIQVPLAQLGEADFIAVQVLLSSTPSDLIDGDGSSDFLLSEFRNLSASTTSATRSLVKFCLFGANFPLSPTRASLVSVVKLPSLISSPIAFQLDTKRGSRCDTQGLFAPLMRQETPLINESKYHPNVRSAVLSTHFSSAYTPIRVLSPAQAETLGVTLTFWLDPEYCGGGAGDEGHAMEIQIKLDYYETMRRVVLRYRTAFVSCPLGLLSLLFWIQLRGTSRTGTFISFHAAASLLLTQYLAKILAGVALLQLVQALVLQRSSRHRPQQLLPFADEFARVQPPRLLSDLLLGQPHSPFVVLDCCILLASFGWITAVAFFLDTLLTFVASVWIKSIDSLAFKRANHPSRKPQRNNNKKKSWLLVLLVALATSNLLFAPYHFTFLVLTLVHFLHTARSAIGRLRPLRPSERTIGLNDGSERQSRHHINTTLLLTMLWLLPISTTTLLVWLRNLQEGNYAAFSDGRHPAAVLGFAALVFLLHHQHQHPYRLSSLRKAPSSSSSAAGHPRPARPWAPPPRVFHPSLALWLSSETGGPWRVLEVLSQHASEATFLLAAAFSICYGTRHTSLLFSLLNYACLALSLRFFLAMRPSPVVP